MQAIKQIAGQKRRFHVHEINLPPERGLLGNELGKGCIESCLIGFDCGQISAKNETGNQDFGMWAVVR